MCTQAAIKASSSQKLETWSIAGLGLDVPSSEEPSLPVQSTEQPPVSADVPHFVPFVAFWARLTCSAPSHGSPTRGKAFQGQQALHPLDPRTLASSPTLLCSLPTKLRSPD